MEAALAHLIGEIGNATYVQGHPTHGGSQAP